MVEEGGNGVTFGLTLVLSVEIKIVKENLMLA